MKVIKLIPQAKKTVKAAVVQSFLYRDAAAFAGTPLQFLKNNPDFHYSFNGQTA